MKILAINSSPHGEHGCTSKMLKPLLAGMEVAGAETEVIYLNQLKMRECDGCLACWFKTPGECIHKDDIAAVHKKFIAADFIIFATPLYVYNVSGLLKIFLDRLIPIALPFMEESKNEPKVTSHPSRYSISPKKMLLVSPCGFPEYEHFKPLTFYMRFLADPSRFDCEYLGEILRPAAEMMQVPELEVFCQPYFANLKIAGKQLIENGRIDKELNDKLHELWISPAAFRERANKFFADKLKEKQG